ncbi:rho gtpase-activating protein 68f [Anaeramoeba flamelloides]|uniref:Rho gtpase-activating protein 68f n=1 Tax=Anaeramoeba flamelloides TaxID=1746091 RepID=A0ABQ8X5P0_9EUKA|nr:rho gtpase-activating protein 68f [Anaeramoeba flamelloides]
MSVKRLFRKKKKGDENEKDSDTISSDGEKKIQSKVFGLSIKTLAKNLPSKKKNIPLIITQLVGTIEELYIRKQGLFLNSGNKNLIKEKVIELNQRGTINTLSIKDPHTLTTLLKLVLQNLKEPLLTFKLYDQFIKSNDVDTIIKTVKILPQVNLSVLVYIMKFFRNVSLESKFNKMKPNTLASIITPILLRAKKKKRKSHPNAFSVIEKMIFYYDKIFLIFEFGDENPKLEDSFSDLISYTTATDPFVNFLDNLDDKVSNFNEADVVQLTASEIISMSVMKLLKLNLPKKEELMPQIEVSKNNEKNEQKKKNEKNEQKNIIKPPKNSKKNKKTKKKNKKNKNKKSKGKQSKKTIQTIGIGNSDTSDDSEEEREIRRKEVKKVRFNFFVECFGEDDEKQEKRKNLLMKRNEEQPEFKEFDKQRKAEEKRYQELMEELKKKEKKEKEEKRKDKKKNDKKKKKGKKIKKSSKKNNESSDSSNSSSQEDQINENKKVVKKQVRFAPNIVIFGGEQDLGNKSDEQIKNKDFESLRKLHNQNEFKTLEDENNKNNNSSSGSNNNNNNNNNKEMEMEIKIEKEKEKGKENKNEIIEDDPDNQNFDIGMEVSFDELMNELDFLNDEKTVNENEDEKEEEEEEGEENTEKKMIEKEPIYKIQIETINVELNEEEKFRINLINQILESFNQYKSFKQNFQNLLITEIFKKKINTNEKNGSSYWYGSLLDAGLGLNYQKIILLLRILITEVVVFSKEFQQMNNGQKPLNVKDWNPVLDQIEQIGEFKELLPKISAKYIANIWKWSKNRNKILALTENWKKEKLELSDPLSLIRKKMQLIKSSLTKVTQLENEIEEISKKIDQDEIEKIKKQVFQKKKFVYDKQRKKISFTMI